jgi:hypothetical protein
MEYEILPPRPQILGNLARWSAGVLARVPEIIEKTEEFDGNYFAHRSSARNSENNGWLLRGESCNSDVFNLAAPGAGLKLFIFFSQSLT